MYRIELSPGEETVFRSIEELAVAIKRGVVTPRARIFHNASSKWLPIQFHPHYKAAVSMPLTQAALVAGPQAKPLSSLTLEPPAEPEPLTAPSAEAPAASPNRKKKKVRADHPAGESRSRRRSKPRRQLRIALIGALLVGGAQWVLSVPLFSRATPPVLVEAQRHLIAVPAAAMERVSAPNTAAMIPVLPSRATSAAPVAGAEPRGRVTTPSFGGTSAVETGASDDVAPPATIELATPALPRTDTLGAGSVDSTNQKVLQGILTTVSGGGTAPPKAAPKK